MGAEISIHITRSIFLLLPSPDELWVTSRTFVHACEFCCAVSSSRKQHLNFSRLFFTPDAPVESKLSLGKNWKRFRSVWPSAPLVAKATARVCLSKRSLLTGTCRASNRAVFPWWTCRQRKLRSRNDVMIVVSCAGRQIKQIDIRVFWFKCTWSISNAWQHFYLFMHIQMKCRENFLLDSVTG